MDKKVKEILFTKQELIKKIDIVTKKINQNYADQKEPVIALGLLKGCINFFGQIMTKLDFELVNEFVNVSHTSDNTIKLDYGLNNIDLKDKKVLIIEDIVDDAIDLIGVISILKNRGVKDVKVVTLLDKINGRKSGFKPTWSIIEDETNDWLVGWGLDVDEWGRRLPYIGVLKDEYKK